MEPTNRRETGTRPSPWKRYGPFIAIVVVLAIVGVIIAVAGGGGGDDSSGKNNEASGSGTDINTAGGPTIINSSNKDSIDWGPNCDTKTMQVKIPWTGAAACVKPFKGDNGGATSDGVTKDS